MAQTNTVSLVVQMSAVTAIGVADRPEDCSKFLLQRLRSSLLVEIVRICYSESITDHYILNFFIFFLETLFYVCQPTFSKRSHMMWI